MYLDVWKITMDWWLFTFLLGSILSLFLPIVPELFYLVIFIFILIALIFILNKSTRSSSGLMVGVAWLVFSALRYNNVWQDNLLDVNNIANSPLLLQGEVVNIPSLVQDKKIISNTNKSPKKASNKTNRIVSKYRFNFNVTHINRESISQPFLLRLSWNESPFEVYQGQQWQLKVKIKPAHGFANVGGFSYQTWLRQKSIVATGYVLNGKENNQLNDDLSIRQQLLIQTKTLLPQEPLSALLLALSFGERSQVTKEQWQVLQATGTQHLIAISGLHLGLVASGSFLICLFLLKVFPAEFFINRFKCQWLLTFNLRVWAITLSCLITFYYAYLAGFSLPTIRALLMLLIYWCIRLCGIKFSLSRWLLIAIFILILLNPSSLFSASFWLSLYAVSIIFLVMWRFSKQLLGTSHIIAWCKSLLLIQVSISLLMLPLVAMINYQISLISLFANLIAVPLMSLTSIPLCLLAVLLLPLSESASAWLFELALQSIKLIWQWFEILAAQSWATIDISNQQVLWIIAIFLVTALSVFLSLKRGFIIISAGAILLTVLALAFNEDKSQGWQVTILDVGQGLSIVIEKNRHGILYDTGASYPSGFNLVDAVVMPYLKHQGLKKLDKVIISHSDNDHAGGLKKLRQLISIDEVIANDKSLKGDSYCQQGYEFLWQQLTFTMLSPNSLRGEDNDDSCVIRISDGKYSVLLTGDISAKVERVLLSNKEISTQLNVNILVAPHHGSKTSSSDVFIKQVSPSAVIFSAGFLNRWKMPMEKIVQRYQKHKVSVFNTAENGMIQLDISNNGIHVKPYRQSIFPYWFTN